MQHLRLRSEMDNLDDFLNSLGIESTQVTGFTSVGNPDPREFYVDTGTLPTGTITSTTISVPQQEPEPVSLTENDYNDILNDMGFEEIPGEDADAEEIDDFDDEDEEEDDRYTEDGEENTPRRNIPCVEGGDEDIDWSITLDYGANQVVSVHQNEETGTIIASNVIASHTSSDSTGSSEPAQEESQNPIIPLNSPTLLLDESTSRFSGTEWFNEIQKQSVIIAGIGGIGSNLAFQLSRMNPRSLVMYDDDMVEVANMSGQLYAKDDIGKHKVTAISEMIQKYTNTQNIYAIAEKFTDETEAGNIMMCGFDSMAARRAFFASWCNHMVNMEDEERKKCLFIDGRLSIDTLQVFCFTGDDNANILRYQNEYLFNDDEADETICSMKQTTYLACMIGSIMVNLFTNFVANTLDPIIPYDMPFFTEYDAQNMIFKTIK